MKSRSPVDPASTVPGKSMRLLPDALAAVVVIGVFWAPATAASDWPRAAIGAVSATVTAGALLLRWRLPAASTVTAAVATLAGSALGVCQDPMLATAWCLYPFALARAAQARTLMLVLAGLFAALAAVTGVPDANDVGRRLVLAVAALSVSWLLGTAVGRRIALAREAERARVRLEVARDVHDVVGHALGVISAEAGVTRSLPDAGERELRDSLADIETHARRALEEVQALVRALRSSPGPGAGDERAEEETAVAGVRRLPSVIDATRAAGVRVDARIALDGHVDDMVGAVVFRIVQEALSNVVRHAAGAACTVDVHEDDGTIVVRVRDHGPGARWHADHGFGLEGMRERARLAGGTVTWRNHPEGGFEVEARLPGRGAR